jgi:hypothetical protein
LKSDNFYTGQFFEDVVPFSEQLANEGKIVIIAALDGTYQRQVLFYAKI